MQYINGNDTLAFANPIEVKSMSFDNRKFVYQNYIENEQKFVTYFEVLKEGKSKLLLRRLERMHAMVFL